MARYFNMFGELIEIQGDMKGLEQAVFRPRPQTIFTPEPKPILRHDQVAKLKKDYKKKYEKLFREEESADKKQ